MPWKDVAKYIYEVDWNATCVHEARRGSNRVFSWKLVMVCGCRLLMTRWPDLRQCSADSEIKAGGAQAGLRWLLQIPRDCHHLLGSEPNLTYTPRDALQWLLGFIREQHGFPHALVLGGHWKGIENSLCQLSNPWGIWKSRMHFLDQYSQGLSDVRLCLGLEAWLFPSLQGGYELEPLKWTASIFSPWEICVYMWLWWGNTG